MTFEQWQILERIGYISADLSKAMLFVSLTVGVIIMIAKAVT